MKQRFWRRQKKNKGFTNWGCHSVAAPILWDRRFQRNVKIAMQVLAKRSKLLYYKDWKMEEKAGKGTCL